MKSYNLALSASLPLFFGESSAKNIFLPNYSSNEGRNPTANNYRRRGALSKRTSSRASKADCDFDLDIQLFEDSTLMTFNPDKEACKKGKSFVGTTRDGKKHINLVPLVGANGAFAASMIDDDTGVVCSILPDANGDMVVLERSQEDFEDEEDPPKPPDDDGWDVNGRELAEVVSPRSAASSLRGSSDNENSDDSRSLRTKTIIDVLVLWTADAECNQSLRPSGCTRTATTQANIRALIDLAVEETNTAYVLSGVNAELRLAHAAYTRYAETGSYSTALRDLRGDNDGEMDEVHTLRNRHGADVVVLIVGMAGSCGIGYVGPRRDLMFSVTKYSCATGYFTFGHEIGHNLGCNHDKGTRDACSSSNYNYGYRDPQARFRSILAYNCGAGDCEDNAGGGCARVQRFSNTQFSYNGRPMGSATVDNARHINNVKDRVAGYYTATSTATKAPTNQPTSRPSSPAAVPDNPDMELPTPDRNGAKADDARGVFFTVLAKKNIVVTGMTIIAKRNAASRVFIYTRDGLYDAKTNDEGWTLVYEGDIPDQKSTKFPLDDFSTGVGIAAGHTQSFYVFSRKGILYTASEDEGSPYGEDESVVVNEGRATKSWFRKPIGQTSVKFAGVVRYRQQ